MEISFLGNATIRGGINATDMGTLWSIMNHDGTAHSEGKGILTSKATGEMATYTFQAIGGYDPDGKLRNHGSMFFNSNTSSSGQLSFLNGMVGVFADEMMLRKCYDKSMGTKMRPWFSTIWYDS